MSQDVECPYCEKWQEINHDDGHGYSEDEWHEQDCNDCGKSFIFTTGIIFHYSSQKADCLNDGKHVFKPSRTYPKECTRIECETCNEQRQPTEEEWKSILHETTRKG